MMKYGMAVIIFAHVVHTLLGRRTHLDEASQTATENVAEVVTAHRALLQELIRESMTQESATMQQLIREEMRAQSKAISEEVASLKEEIAALRLEFSSDGEQEDGGIRPKLKRANTWGSPFRSTARAPSAGIMAGSKSRSFGKVWGNMTKGLSQGVQSIRRQTSDMMSNIKGTGMSLYGAYEQTLMGVTQQLGTGVNKAFQGLQKASKYMWDQIANVGFGKFLFGILNKVLNLAVNSATEMLVTTVAHKTAEIFADEGIDWIGDRLSQVVAGLIGSSGFPGAGALGIAVAEMLKKGISFLSWLKLPEIKNALEQMMGWTKQLVVNAAGKMMEFLRGLASQFWQKKVTSFITDIQKYFCSTMPSFCKSMGFSLFQANATAHDTSTNVSSSNGTAYRQSLSGRKQEPVSLRPARELVPTEDGPWSVHAKTSNDTEYLYRMKQRLYPVITVRSSIL